MNRSLLVSTTVIAAFTLPVFAVDHHVTTAQELQNALTTAAANAADDSIYLAAGYYQGNFSFTSAEANSLTIEAEPGLTRGEVTLDGAGVGGALNLSSSAVSNFVVRRITIARNCGDANRDALLISTLGTVQINDLASLAANQTGRGIHVAAAASLTIEDSEVSGAGGYIGHGILIEGVGGPITMNRNVVKGNCTYWSTTYGGGIHISGTSGDNIISLDRNTILNNSNSAGWWGKCGGLYIDGGGGTDLVTVTNNTITGNSGAYVSNGGGLMISASSLVLSGNQFSSNASYFSGGGCYFSGGSANILNNSFVSNISLTGTQWNTEGSALKLDCSGCSVTNNVFRSNSGACVMSCSGSTATITSNQFFDNSNGTLLCWGAVNLVSNRFERNSRDNGDMISLGLNGNATVIGNTILDSRVTPGGRVIGISGSSNNTLNFLRNRVTGGNCGTLNASGFGTMLVADNLLAGNNAPNTEGVGAYLQPGGQLDLVNNTITGNSGSAGGGLRINIPGTTEVVHCYNNIIWGNTATGAGSDVLIGGFGSRTEFYHNNVHDMRGVWSITGNNIDLAPVFFDPSNGDYHLRYNSPGLNSGDNAAPGIETIDIDGNARVQDGTVDLGCFEFSNIDHHPADTNGDWVIDEAEFNAYAAAWKNDQPWGTGPSPVPADYLTRAGYLKQNGGTYHNDGGGKPVCWKPGTGN